MKKILIIEDDESIHNVIEELLKKENYDTYNAYSGTEALLLLEKEKYDLRKKNKYHNEIINKITKSSISL